MDRFLREPEVQNITGLSRTTRWRLAREGKFPKPYQIGGGNIVAWRESDIKSWMDEIVGEPSDIASQPETAAA